MDVNEAISRLEGIRCGWETYFLPRSAGTSFKRSNFLKNERRIDSMSWKNEKFYTKASEIKDYLNLSDEEEKQMEIILERFPMSVPQYYLSLIDRDDPADPIRRMCIPSLTETDLSGDFDTSGEADNTVQEGLQHKYTQTALVLSTNCCAMYCRHCFRKRLVGVDDTETAKQFDTMMQYIAEHKELNNILVSGGDALMMPNHMIRNYLERLTAMEHLDLIRFGTRIPVVFPTAFSKTPNFRISSGIRGQKTDLYRHSVQPSQGTYGQIHRSHPHLPQNGIRSQESDGSSQRRQR